jgi:hypothetical protein
MLHVATEHTCESQLRVNWKFTEWKTARKFEVIVKVFVTKNKCLNMSEV